MAAASSIHRERWSFQRNERWFEDTLPHLGEQHFRQAFRVSPTTFRYLVESCRPSLERQTTNMREAISVEKRVAAGMYRLCSSAEDRTIADLFGIGRSTVNTVFREFCKTVVDRLEDAWIQMAVGALDGCHFPVSPPKDHAADYYNYKGWYSMILLAVVDHRYCFKYINVGAPGRCHDAYVYGRSWLCEKIERGLLASPVAIIEHCPVKPLILCDQAFPLTETLLKPFPSASPGCQQNEIRHICCYELVTGIHSIVWYRSTKAIFNYNLSKTRRIVENAFGRLKVRFRFTMKRMECKLANARQAIKTACILHNICESFRDAVEQHWEQDAQTFQALYEQPFHTTTVSTGQGEEVRQALAKYFWNRAQQNALPS
ncbi:uncharacterized protein LOC119391642 [Rhipicephalus sanguineus]|uniref:uncharacterized protein LOC119391642 n=1 Tax=Rhipicephalus sanguineus TaxID=34632 RepID=UPI0020C34F62|nr:uncharacterized protein LOC119391642 [Rhipicephalus sanguineus]